MSDRREPTISGTRVEPGEARKQAARGQSAPSKASPGQTASGQAASGQAAPGRPRPKTQANVQRPSAQAPQRPVVVRSKLTPFALFVAIVGLGLAAYAGWIAYNLQNQLVLAEDRLGLLEEKLVMSDDETTASAAALQVSLKDAHSEIRKLWGVSHDRNRKSIADNKTAISAAKKQAATATQNAKALKTEITRVEGLVTAQKSSMNAVEQSAATISAQARSLNEKSARTEKKVAELEDQLEGVRQDIEAINGFRRSVNQQLLQLKSGESAAP